MIAFIRGFVRIIAFLLVTLVLVPPYLLLFPLGQPVRRRFIYLWNRSVCALAGFKINRQGQPYQAKEVLLVGNHVSYLDIPVLSFCNHMIFVAKSDVAGWPLFGFLAKITQTAFIERNPTRAKEQKDLLQKRLLNGENLMFFPEGTSSDGEGILPFKSSLFEIVADHNVREYCYVQPVTIAFYKHKNGQALSRGEQDQYAWFGDMAMAPHLWNVLCRKGIQVDVIFHPARRADTFEGRKEIASWAATQVHDGLKSLKSPT